MTVKIVTNPKVKNSLMHTFYRTSKNIIFEWLNPLDYDIQNLPSIPNTPKGFGPLFKI
ncbi:MAG: hypothetical protein ACJAU2_000878 [Maribacter sp.]|jgi:hypothetical protein